MPACTMKECTQNQLLRLDTTQIHEPLVLSITMGLFFLHAISQSPILTDCGILNSTRSFQELCLPTLSCKELADAHPLKKIFKLMKKVKRLPRRDVVRVQITKHLADRVWARLPLRFSGGC